MSYRKHLMTSDEPPSELYKAVELGTNLAEVGTDLISRQAAIEAVQNRHMMLSKEKTLLINDLEKLPPAEPATNNSEFPNSSDTISRAKAIDEIKEIYEWHDNVTKERIIEHFKQLPPAQPERIKGHWIEIALSNHTYKCSVCGRLLVNITDGKNNVAKNYPYCHCGADMRKTT